MIVSAGRDSTVRVWDISQGREVSKFLGHKGHVCALAVTAQGLIVSGGQDSTVKLWDPRSKVPAASRAMFSPGAAVTNLIASRETGSVIATGADGLVCVATPSSLEILHQWGGDHSNFIYTTEATGGGYVLTGGGEGSLSVRREDGTIISTTKIDDNAVRGVGLTDSGTIVIITDDGNLVTL